MRELPSYFLYFKYLLALIFCALGLVDFGRQMTTKLLAVPDEQMICR